MDGLATLKAARVTLDELVLDPAYPFAVRLAPRLTEKRRREAAAALRGGWLTSTATERAVAAVAMFARMDNRAFDALVGATVDARAAVEPDPCKRWVDTERIDAATGRRTVEPWGLWRTTLDDEQDRRDRARPVVQAAMGIKARLKEAA